MQNENISDDLEIDIGFTEIDVVGVKVGFIRRSQMFNLDLEKDTGDIQEVTIENGKIVYYIRSDKTGKISKRFNNQLFAPTDISEYFHREYNERRKTTQKNMFNFMR